MSALDIAVASGIFSSNSQARRLIEQGGFEVNQKLHSQPTEVIMLRSGEVIRIGKKNFYKAKL
jgi:tyrosyl-tRNA synthetase